MSLFNPRTQPEIVGEMINRLIATTPLTDVNYGSVFTTMLEAAAQEDDEQYFQMLEIIRSYSLDTSTGSDLDSRAFEYGLSRLPAASASTKITIGDSSVTKVFTGVYSGLNGSAAGANYVYGDSATGFKTTGSIIVGRGTPNAETVAYSSITTFPNYVKFNLSSLLAYDHGTDETIIQSNGGNRIIGIGTTVKVPASDINPEISYVLSASATILDGEREVYEVPVTASLVGTAANVPIGSIQVFDSDPFVGAYVSNPSRITNGKDIESDQELRDRIKSTIQSLSRGTKKSIISGTIGLVNTTENKRVVSASIIEPTIPADVVKLYIDDGTGFIPSFSHVGAETVVVLATGGEKFVNTKNFPVIKAFVETGIDEPYNLSAISFLFVEVGGAVETITFTPTSFANPAQATAQEVLNVINQYASSFEARLSSGGTKVRIFSRSNFDEQIQVTGGSANTGLEFPTDKKYTAKLYKKRSGTLSLLNKDGVTAIIESGNSAGYDMSLNQNFCIVVDGKTKNASYVNFEPSMFVTPSNVLASEIAVVIEDQVPGLKSLATSNETRVSLRSNIERSAKSKLKVIENFTKIMKYLSSYADITTQCQTSLINVMFFEVNLQYLYFGHLDVIFQSIYFDPSVSASAPITFTMEYFNGSVWLPLQFDDDTLGFTQRGFITFKCPHTWSKTIVNSGDPLFYVRLQRTMATLATAPIESTLRICSANEIFGFSTVERVGVDRDYTMNRFLGQIELVSPLQPNDSLYLGTSETRAAMISSAGPYALSGGEVLNLLLDGVAQSITFQVGDFFTPGAALATEVLARLVKDLRGATAVLDSSKIKIITNSFEGGSIRAVGGTANTVLQFTNSLIQNLDTHVANLKSVSGPFVFPADNNLIVIMDENTANNFSVPLFRKSTVASGTVSGLVDTTLNTIWPLADDLTFDGGFDVLITSGLQIGLRRKIASYIPASGVISFNSPIPAGMVAGDEYEIIPSTCYQIEKFFNNKAITLISTQAEIFATDGGNKLQISSLVSGEVGSVFVSGGSANSLLQFSTLQKKGVDAYRHWNGLLQQTQWTVDGRDDNQGEYPGIRAGGVQVEVLEPVKKPITVQATITPREGVTLASISNSVKSAISSYINTLDIGGDVVVSEIIYVVKGVSGVADIHITSPADNIAVADSELARIDEKNILIG